MCVCSPQLGSDDGIWRNRMPYHSSLFYLTSFKTAEQYVGEIVRMDEEGEWENAEVGG